MSEKDTVLRRPEENGAKTTVFVSFTGAHGTFDGQECSSEYPQQNASSVMYPNTERKALIIVKGSTTMRRFRRWAEYPQTNAPSVVYPNTEGKPLIAVKGSTTIYPDRRAEYPKTKRIVGYTSKIPRESP